MLVDGALLLLFEVGAVSVAVVAAGVDLIDEVVAGLVLLAELVDVVGLVFVAVLVVVVDLAVVVLFEASALTGVLVFVAAVV